MKNYLY